MSTKTNIRSAPADPAHVPFTLIHHGGRTTVTGSCHEVRLPEGEGILVDCGLFQGEDAERAAEAVPEAVPEAIDFPIDHLRALVVTHAHIDHVGRIPYLLAAGFTGPIICTEPTALLLPLVLEDAVKVGVTRDRRLIAEILDRLRDQMIAVPYKQWHALDIESRTTRVRLKFKPAGHILGSAYVEFDICRVRAAGDRPAGAGPAGKGDQAAKAARSTRLVFSGDLGAPYAPLLPAPQPGWRADVLVLESTYGDGLHPDRRTRRQALKSVLEHALADGGTVLIPAFSLGRTQELLYEIEGIIHRGRGNAVHAEHAEPIAHPAGPDNHRHTPRRSEELTWDDLEIIVDSPLASRFTEAFKALKPHWDAEARRRLRSGRHPLSFEQLYTVDDHHSHLNAVEYLSHSGRPAVVIAASGMATGGRIVNYLKAMLGDERNDVVFVGYQAAGTPGRTIQKYGPSGGYVDLEGTRYTIRAGIHTLRSYSAHADQANLVRFATRFRYPAGWIRLIHGEKDAQQALTRELERAIPGVVVD